MHPELRMPLTVYFDGSCPLCTAETSALKACDHDGALRMVDCSAPTFADVDVTAAGIQHGELLRIIHARDADGRWLRGVEVFEAMYRIAGFEAMARIWANPRLRPLWDRGYPWVARNRMLLSRLGVIHVFGWLVRRNARRTALAGCGSAECGRRTTSVHR